MSTDRVTYAGVCPFATHYTKEIQAKHIDDRAVLPVIAKLSRAEPNMGWVFTWDLEPHFSVPWKVLMAKLRGLKARDLVDGCTCGCRGDFVLTEKGRALVDAWAAAS